MFNLVCVRYESHPNRFSVVYSTKQSKVIMFDLVSTWEGHHMVRKCSYILRYCGTSTCGDLTLYWCRKVSPLLVEYIKRVMGPTVPIALGTQVEL